MNPWLTRALISVAGSVVTTTAIVTTAKNPNKKKKKRRRKKSAKGADGVKVEEDVPRSMGAQAAHDFRSGHDGGMTTAELIENIKGSGGKIASGLKYIGGGLFGGGRPPPPPAEDGEEGTEGEERPRRRPPPKGKRRRRRPPPKGKRRRRPPPRGKRRRRPPPRKEEKGDFEAIRDEVAKHAASKITRGAADKIGAGDVLENIKDGAESVKDNVGKLAEGIKDSIPEDLGERVGDALEDAGEGIRDIGKKVGDTIKGAFEDPDAVDWSTSRGAKDAVNTLSDRVDRQLENLGRWLEGADPPGPATKPPASSGEVVDAKLDDDPEIVEAKLDEEEPAEKPEKP
jgi:hypothetical protein